MLSYIPHRNKKHTWRTAIFVLIIMCFSVAIVYFVRNYSQFLKINIAIEQVEPIDSTQQITIIFPFPMVQSIIEQGVTIFPKKEIQFSWENKNRKLNIIPSGYWQPESKYEIMISLGKNKFFSHFDKMLYFSTKPYPIVTSTLPVNGAKDIEISIEEPITFNFNCLLDDYDVKFEVNPQRHLESQLSDDKKTIRLVSNNDLEKDTKYIISAFLKLKQQPDNDYHKVGELFFYTPLPPPPPIERNKNPEMRLAEAILYTKPQITTGKYIDIGLKYQNMVIFENGKAIGAHIISSGKRGMETPTGQFSIQNKTPRAWSKKYALFMPYWMAFLPSGSMGIHELPEWPGGYKEGANHLGTPVSHGCVRLGVGDAKEVYNWAEIGTPVIIHE
jgi:lipoprotein-anchoring transpeptidase ErfK/SrfK